MDKQVGNAAVLRLGGAAGYARGPGVRTTPLVTASLGATAMLSGMTDIGPGAAIPLHHHNCEESVVVIAGTAIASIDGIEHMLGPGDATWIAAGVPHFFRNPAQHGDLRILWTYGAIDATRTIVATGDTRRIDLEQCREAGR